jgi:hypothetical protein
VGRSTSRSINRSTSRSSSPSIYSSSSSSSATLAPTRWLCPNLVFAHACMFNAVKLKLR